MNHQLACGLLIALLGLIASCSGKGDQDDTGANTSTPTAAASGPAIPLELDGDDATVESLAGMLNEIENRLAKSPRDRIDPAAVIPASRDAREIFEWLRENTRAVSYEGSLKGPLGVLMDRQGNSLDRALLFARLLELAGYEARVMGGTLSSVEQLKLLADNSNVTEPGSTIGDETADLQGLRKEAATIADMIVGQTGEMNAMTPVAQTLHYWVQYRDGTGWVDADPTLGATGKTRPIAAVRSLERDPKTYGAPRLAGNASRADELNHFVTMQIRVERWEKGQLRESDLASMEFDSVGGPFATSTVTFMPVNRDAEKAVQRSFDNGADLSEKLLGETAWAVILSDNQGRVSMGRMFDDAGIVGELPRSFDPSGKLAGVAGSAFGGLAGALDADTTSEVQTVLTGLIADYEINVPGKPVRRLRRFIFDSIGPEARGKSRGPLAQPRWTDEQVIERGADLAALNDTLVAFAGLPINQYVDRYAGRMIGGKDAILKYLAGPVDVATGQQAAEGLSFRTLELYAATRESAIDPQLALVEPQIIRRIVRYDPNTNASTLDLQVSGDLVWNRLAPARSPVSGKALVKQGVLDTLQESHIVLADETALPAQTTAAFFREAARQGIESMAVREANDSRLGEFPGPARALMVEELDSGFILVTPRKPLLFDGKARMAWWRVDPRNGQVVGVMDNGLNGSFVSFAITVTTTSGIVLMQFIRVPAGPAAREWARHMAQRAGNMQLYGQLLRVAAGFIHLTGRMPPF
jgi:hypothetical protein